MNQGVYSLSAAMINQLNRVDVISNNLANVNTNGFKEDNLIEGSFNHYLEKLAKKDIAPTKLDTINNTVPKIDGNFINGIIGSIVETNNPLDFALKTNDTFFKVADKEGNTFLTRDGSFKNIGGVLSTFDGKKVLNNNNQPINIADGFESQVAIVTTSYSNLNKVGNNNYKIADDTKLKPIIDNDQFMVLGAIEKSNINAVSTMVALIDSQRRLEQAQKAITGIGELSEKLLTKIDGR
ncbi:MAG: flagellar hook-basal body complex protein [Arcobacteraceae bacterium]|jgi:flagellar basal-body rod protein FlgG|nr:flagellar hook-basal body complex protein [Arcobacteraceae bacterium]